MLTTPDVAVAPPFPKSRYCIIGQIGQGQFGRVYCAVKKKTGRIFALKDLEHRVAPTNKFLRELTYLVLLRHPNIVACHAVEYHAGGQFLVMDYCEGGTLRDLMNGDGELGLAGKIHLIYQVLLGLDHAHQRQIIHCDLKPENILLIPRHAGWHAKITDFGIARLTEITGNPNYGNGYTGSPAYTAPERFYGKFSAESDIYAAGILLFELITGERPFSGFPKALQAAHLNARVNFPHDFPDPLKPIVQKALEKLPQRRYRSAAAMAEELVTVHQELASIQQRISSYQFIPPERSQFTAESHLITPLIAPVQKSAAAFPWLYLAQDNGLNFWEYSDPGHQCHPIPRWSLRLPGRLKHLSMANQRLCLLQQIKAGQNSTSQWYDWLVSLTSQPRLPPPLLQWSSTNLQFCCEPQATWLGITQALTAEESVQFQIYRSDQSQAVGNPRHIQRPLQMMGLDPRHGLMVHQVSTDKFQRSLFSLFTRRGDLFKGFHLNFLVKQLVVNPWSRNHVFGLADDTAKVGVLIRLQPLQVQRLLLNLHPDFIQPFPWGYLLANRKGRLALLDYEGFLIGNLDLKETITAITPLERYQCAIATWEGNKGNLHLLNLGQQIEDIIIEHQEAR